MKIEIDPNNSIMKLLTNNLSSEEIVNYPDVDKLIESSYIQVENYYDTSIERISGDFVSRKSIHNVLIKLFNDIGSLQYKYNNKEKEIKPNLKSKVTDNPVNISATILAAFISNLFSRNVMGLCEQVYSEKRPPRLFLIGENIQNISDSLNIEYSDMLKWIATHEITHVLQLTYSDVAFDFVNNKLKELSDSDNKKEVVADVKAMMTYIEGMADHTMDQPGLLGKQSISLMRSKINLRRSQQKIHIKMLMKILGNKNDQYIKGKKFCDSVVAKTGDPKTLLLPLENIELIPTQEDIKDPDLWIRRI